MGFVSGIIGGTLSLVGQTAAGAVSGALNAGIKAGADKVVSNVKEGDLVGALDRKSVV